MKKPVNPKCDKVYVVMEEIDHAFFLAAIYSTSAAAINHAKYLTKKRPAKNYKYHVEEHDVYLAHIPD